MDILDPEFADRLQYLSLILELLGLSLALLEIRFPSSAEKVARYIVSETASLESNIKNMVSGLGSFAIVTSILISIVLAVGVLWWTFSRFLHGDYVYAFGGAGMSLLILSWISVKWIPNRPIGTLGVVVAILGVIGEIVQLRFN